MAQTKTRKKRAAPAGGAELQHAPGCPGEREESYAEVTPEGAAVVVSRCLDCPAHHVDHE